MYLGIFLILKKKKKISWTVLGSNRKSVETSTEPLKDR